MQTSVAYKTMKLFHCEDETGDYWTVLYDGKKAKVICFTDESEHECPNEAILAALRAAGHRVQLAEKKISFIQTDGFTVGFVFVSPSGRNYKAECEGSAFRRFVRAEPHQLSKLESIR